MAKKNEEKSIDTELTGKPGVEVSTSTESGRFKISIGIKNTIPITAAGGRWASVAPFINISKEFEQEPEDLLSVVISMYELVLPSYGYLLLQENARMMGISEGTKSVSEAALELLGLSEE